MRTTRFANIIAMNCVPIAWRDVNWDYVNGRVGNIMNPDLYFKLRDHIYADFNYMNVNDLGAMEFAGGYPGNLHEEINNYSIIAGVVARTVDFDIIHAHDWLTYPRGSTLSKSAESHCASTSMPPITTAAVVTSTRRFIPLRRTVWTTPTASCAFPT